MEKKDWRHIAFHALAGLYFLWLLVLVASLGITCYYKFGAPHNPLTSTFSRAIFTNLIMGALMMFVVRMFRANPEITRFITISYYVLLASGLVIIALIYFVQ